MRFQEKVKRLTELSNNHVTFKIYKLDIICILDVMCNSNLKNL